MIEAGADEVIDPQTIANYLAAAQPLAMVDYAILPGAPHIIHQSPRARHEVRQRMRAWMVTQLEMVWCQRRTGALIVQNASALW
jgi:alpha-beta hydrolase superfamily lysophospholipase